MVSKKKTEIYKQNLLRALVYSKSKSVQYMGQVSKFFTTLLQLFKKIAKTVMNGYETKNVKELLWDCKDQIQVPVFRALTLTRTNSAYAFGFIAEILASLMRFFKSKSKCVFKDMTTGNTIEDGIVIGLTVTTGVSLIGLLVALASSIRNVYINDH